MISAWTLPSIMSMIVCSGSRGMLFLQDLSRDMVTSGDALKHLLERWEVPFKCEEAAR
jgi:hypothetical protein